MVQPVWLWSSLSAKPTSPSSPSEKFPGAVAGINSPEAGRDLAAFGEGRTQGAWAGSELGPPRPRRQRPVTWPLGPGRSFHSILIAVSNLRGVAQEGPRSGACCSSCLSAGIWFSPEGPELRSQGQQDCTTPLQSWDQGNGEVMGNLEGECGRPRCS